VLDHHQVLHLDSGLLERLYAVRAGRGALDGGVTNAGVPRYRDLDGRHLTHVPTGTDAPDTVWLRCRARTSDIRVGIASRLTAEAPATILQDGPRVTQPSVVLPEEDLREGPYGLGARRTARRAAQQPERSPDSGCSRCEASTAACTRRWTPSLAGSPEMWFLTVFAGGYSVLPIPRLVSPSPISARNLALARGQVLQLRCDLRGLSGSGPQ
jgi:hypothetical protein